MITIVLHEDKTIEFISDSMFEDHVVIINSNEKWTDSPGLWSLASESEQAELIANSRNMGFEDRNP